MLCSACSVIACGQAKELQPLRANALLCLMHAQLFLHRCAVLVIPSTGWSHMTSRCSSSIPTVSNLQQPKSACSKVAVYSLLRLGCAGGQAAPDDSPNDVHQPGELPFQNLQLHSILTCIALIQYIHKSGSFTMLHAKSRTKLQNRPLHACNVKQCKQSMSATMMQSCFA